MDKFIRPNPTFSNSIILFLFNNVPLVCIDTNSISGKFLHCFTNSTNSGYVVGSPTESILISLTLPSLSLITSFMVSIK